MRKAFDANVPKFKPRLKGAAAATLPLEDLVDEAPHAVRVPFGAEPVAAEPVAESELPVEPPVAASVDAPRSYSVWSSGSPPGAGRDRDPT